MPVSGAIAVARLGTVDYAAALRLQEALVAARREDSIGDTLLLLEHPHVFTLGRGADEHFLLARRPDVPVFRVSRGGEVTYHGPGQLIGYPILKLEGRNRDVHLYLRRLEQVMIEALARMGVAAGQCEGLTGVWVGDRKIGSIGVGIRRWITLHGFALNVCTDLDYFAAMIPCGIPGCVMTSVEREAGARPDMDRTAQEIELRFAAVFGYARVAEADAAALWRHVDPALSACEAQNRI
jgi:lipoyl(octanoyl) transferase